MTIERDGSEALDDLFWRDEILEVLFWMRGESLASDINAEELASFLTANVPVIEAQLDRMARLGDLVCEDGRYRLTDQGSQEGAVRFRDSFAELTRQGHGECSPDCICHDPNHASEPCPAHVH